MINSRFEGVRDLAFPCEGKVPRERRMRWPHFIQNSIESTLKGPFLAEKLQIRSVDTSSVTFGDSFPSEGKPTETAARLNQRLLEARRVKKMCQWHILRSAQPTSDGKLSICRAYPARRRRDGRYRPSGERQRPGEGVGLARRMRCYHFIPHFA